ncbi:MAG: hypothetical protein HETSPECPRED_008666 [Heterodermia speciosa]|uniref:MARVEL domain-containing protein n=1 Tax=Heterodermia speciosa TaxID=116794 RepID=A0A8H3FYU0_9LECA|nr:MAG: hypothetical protein HETSPECPRED_008666 [Heterodermia speciosa]
MDVTDLLALGLRAAQFVFAIISLGLNGHAVHWYNTSSLSSSSPPRINFLLFTSIWTLLSLLYLTLTPRFLPSAAHKYAILALDAVTMIFWFAGWVALAVFKENLTLCWGAICHVVTAAIVFGAFEWILFLVTTVLAALHVWRTKGTGSAAPEKHTTAGVTTV